MRTILFDLDDTLLGNPMERFLPQYFGLVGAYTAGVLPDGDMIETILACTQQVIADVDSSRLNLDEFWDAFGAKTGLERSVVEPVFERFYDEAFPSLRPFTQTRPIARRLVEHCLSQGWQVVIATNPLFPARAIEQRLEWAGVPAGDYPFSLVTTLDNMHAAKPNAAYYREILSLVGAKASDSLMVGDSWENDIAPAASVGIETYWVSDAGDSAALPMPTAYGDLSGLLDFLS